MFWPICYPTYLPRQSSVSRDLNPGSVGPRSTPQLLRVCQRDLFRKPDWLCHAPAERSAEASSSPTTKFKIPRGPRCHMGPAAPSTPLAPVPRAGSLGCPPSGCAVEIPAPFEVSLKCALLRAPNPTPAVRMSHSRSWGFSDVSPRSMLSARVVITGRGGDEDDDNRNYHPTVTSLGDLFIYINSFHSRASPLRWVLPSSLSCR